MGKMKYYSESSNICCDHDLYRYDYIEEDRENNVYEDAICRLCGESIFHLLGDGEDA